MYLSFPGELWRRARGTHSASSTLLDKYRLIAKLGEGELCRVYLAVARDSSLRGGPLVVKELKQELTRGKGVASTFLAEARLAARLDHLNVVRTLDSCEELGRYCAVTEYVDGQPLSALVQRARRAGSTPLPIMLQILCDVLTGLQYAHAWSDDERRSLHILHRDVCPDNVLVTYDGEVKLIDFGFAKVANMLRAANPEAVQSDFAYTAPEQVTGGMFDARCEVFAVGVMLWEAIAGKRFADRVASDASRQARAQGLEPRIAAVVPDVDPALAVISDRALAIDPAQRFESAEAFRQALIELAQHASERVGAAQIGPWVRAAFLEERRAIQDVIERAKSEDDGPLRIAELPNFARVISEAPGDEAVAVAPAAPLPQAARPSFALPKNAALIAAAASGLGLCAISVWLMVANERQARPALGSVDSAGSITQSALPPSAAVPVPVLASTRGANSAVPAAGKAVNGEAPAQGPSSNVPVAADHREALAPVDKAAQPDHASLAPQGVPAPTSLAIVPLESSAAAKAASKRAKHAPGAGRHRQRAVQ